MTIRPTENSTTPGLLANTKQVLGDEAERIIEIYRQKSPKATPYELSTNIMTDIQGISSIRLAERRAALGKAPTYLYVFAWETPVMGLRRAHTIEIPFVFNHIDVSQSMVGPVSPPMRELEAATAGAWAALAKNGNPNHKGLPAWPAYTADTRAYDDLRHAMPRGERSHGRRPKDHATKRRQRPAERLIH